MSGRDEVDGYSVALSGMEICGFQIHLLVLFSD